MRGLKPPPPSGFSFFAAVQPATQQSHCPNSPSGCKLVAMPELPDIAAYITALEARILGQPL